MVAEASPAPDAATRIAFTPLVPTSSPRKTGSLTSPNSEQQLHRQLIESLVRVAARAQAGEVEWLVRERARRVRGEADAFAGGRPTLAQFPEQCLNLGIGVEARDFFFEDQVRAHAA